MDDLQKLIEQLRANTVQIKEERAIADALFLSIGDGCIATDNEGKIRRINKTALELLGFDEKEVIGKWFPSIVVAVDDRGKPVSALTRPMTRAIMTGKPISERMNYMTKKGAVVPVSATVSPMILKNRPIGAVEVFRSVAKENEVDKMKSEFISIASHQLRTPLTSVKTYAHLLVSGYQGELTTEQLEFMTIILTSVERMSDLIDILLDVSRIEAGKIDIVPKKTDVNHLVSDVIRELEPAAGDKNIKIIVKAPKKPMHAMIDQLLTTEILTNLLSNAIKYTPKKGRVTVELSKKTDDLKLSVSDTGYGIPASDQDRIFTKFFRADNISRREPSGSGLGLYMVKKIIENMGGNIYFKSTYRQGTSFTVEIPVTFL